MSHLTWFEHFKEQLQGLTESYKESGVSVSLLKYAFQEQRLKPEAYFAWAMSHYQLPLLQSQFFTETPPSQELFAQWATHYRWSEECLPVAEWDGSLIVACLQPPQDFPINPSCIFVLAHPESLHSAWNQFHPTVASPLSSDAAPDGIDLAMAQTSTKIHKESYSFDDLGIEGAENSSEEPSSELSLEEQPAENEGLDGILQSNAVIRLEAIPVESEKPPVAEEPAQNVNLPPPPAVENSAPPIEKMNVTEFPRPNYAAKPTHNPMGTGPLALEKFKKKNALLVNEKIKKVLREMKVHFEKSLILSLDEEETQLKVFAWDENFQGMKDTSISIPLQTPSIFNIVASTQKPFHGYISLNEINEKFFEDWNQGRIPDHVTITPIIIKEKLVGMLMGFAEKSAYNRVTLTHAEKLSNEFTQTLQAA